MSIPTFLLEKKSRLWFLYFYPTYINKGETPLVGSPFRTRSNEKPRPLGEVAAAMFAKQTCHEAKRSRKADGEGYNQKRYLT